jgi:hypothetical protein
MSGKDHRNDRAIVGDVKAGVCESFVFRKPIGAGEMGKSGDLVVKPNDQSFEGADGASGDVVRTVVGLLFEEDEKFVRLVGDYVFGKIVSDCADKLVGNGDVVVGH